MKIKLLKERALAFLIDQLIINFIYSILNSIFNLDYTMENIILIGIKWKINLTFVILFSLLYFVFFDLFNNGKTIGKIILRIKNLKIDNSELSVSIKMIRSLIKVISFMFLILAILYYAVTKSIFHDKVSDSITVKD